MIDEKKQRLNLAFKGIGKESFALGVAEAVSGVTSIGTFAFLEDVAPKTLKKYSQCIAKNFIEPHLDGFETNLQRFCGLNECKPDMSKSREERAEQLASTLIKFGTSFVVSLGVKLLTRHYANGALGLHQERDKSKTWWENFRPQLKHHMKVLAVDEGAHIGAFLLVNNGAAKYTDAGISGLASTIQKITGWNEKRAREVASMAIVWELPNLLGLAAGSGVIANDHLKKNTLTWADGYKHTKDTLHNFVR